MNRKILALLAVFLVAISMACVSAAELTETHDFDGLFKMKVNANDNFTNVSNPQDYSSLLKSSMAYKNANETVFVLVYGDSINASLMYLTNGDIDYSYGMENANITKEGDLTLLNATPKMNGVMDGYDLTTFVGITTDSNTPDDSNDDLTVFLAGNNGTLLKEYVNTIEF